MAADPIITALEEQVTCYRQLARLSEVQHEYVQQSQTEQLLHVLHTRQGFLDQLADLEKAIAPAKRNWPDYSGRLDTDSRARAEQLLGETRKLLEEITASDQNDAMVLQQRKLNLGRQINQTTAAKQVNRQYAAAAYGARPRGVDVQR